MKFIFLIVLFISSLASARNLDDVQFVKIKSSSNDNVLIAFKLKSSPKDSFFLVDIVKSDPNSFEKMSHILNKMYYKDEYQLDLDIISFSEKPSGSLYKSDKGVVIKGTLIKK